MKNHAEKSAQSTNSLTGQYTVRHKNLNIGLLACVASLCAFSGIADAAIFVNRHPIVRLANGYKVTGSVPDSIGVTHFVAIPYGMPTTGDMRWRPPPSLDAQPGHTF
ncbi:MAG: hypothetical protein ACI802_003807 [Candidatus Paceibacteria bacterium]